MHVGALHLRQAATTPWADNFAVDKATGLAPAFFLRPPLQMPFDELFGDRLDKVGCRRALGLGSGSGGLLDGGGVIPLAHVSAGGVGAFTGFREGNVGIPAQRQFARLAARSIPERPTPRPAWLNDEIEAADLAVWDLPPPVERLERVNGNLCESLGHGLLPRSSEGNTISLSGDVTPCQDT
jgi:hypothetical protein